MIAKHAYIFTRVTATQNLVQNQMKSTQFLHIYSTRTTARLRREVGGRLTSDRPSADRPNIPFFVRFVGSLRRLTRQAAAAPLAPY